MSIVPDSIYERFRQEGLNPPLPLLPSGSIHRFSSGPGDTDSGWYIGFTFGDAKQEACYHFEFGDWHKAEVVYSAQYSRHKPDAADKKRFKEAVDKSRKLYEAQKREKNRVAADNAKKRFDQASDEFGPNGYLEKKGLTNLYGARISGTTLLVPMVDEVGELKNIEHIFWNEEKKKFDKRGLSGGQRDGLFHIIGELHDVALVCEGYSTGASLYEATGECVIVCFNASNILKVAQALKKKHHELKLFFCADNDHLPSKTTGAVHNTGVEGAEAACAKVGGTVIVPKFKEGETVCEDWDDMRRHYGLDEIRDQVLSKIDRETEQFLTNDQVKAQEFPDEEPGTFKRKCTIENIEFLMKLLRIKYRYNVITKDQEIEMPGRNYTQDNKAVAMFAEISSAAERCGISPKNMQGILTVLTDRRSYNPVKEWIESKPWDGISRIGDLYATVTAAHEDTDLNVKCMKEKLIRLWMISAIAAVYEERGVSAHGVLVFQGAQNLGKTKWFKKLVTPQMQSVIGEGRILMVGNRDSEMQVVNCWLVEFGELEATLKSSRSGPFKAFTTRQSDPIRLPYASGFSKFPRRTVFFGSVNDAEFLVDKTGNRRFWTIECEKLNHDHDVDVQQLWAEVRTLYDAKNPNWYLTQEEIYSLNAHNEQFEEGSPIEERIRAAFNWDLPHTHPMTATEVCMAIGIENPKPGDWKAAGEALTKILGTKSKKIRKDTRGYMLPLNFPKSEPGLVGGWVGGLHAISKPLTTKTTTK